MNVTSHISSTQVSAQSSQGGAPPQTGAGAASGGTPDQGTGAALDALLAFLNMLAGKLAADATVDSNGNDAAKTAGGGTPAGNPGAGKSRSALTADLSGATAFDAQAGNAAGFSGNAAGSSENAGGTAGISQDMLDALAQKFDALAAQGPVSADALAQFRADAVALLKAQGLDDSSIDKSLIALSVQLSPQLTASQMAQLALPITPLVPLPQISPAAGATDTNGLGAVTASSGGGRRSGDAPGAAAADNAQTSAGAQGGSQSASGAKNGPLQVNGWTRQDGGAQINAFTGSAHAAAAGSKTDGSSAGNPNAGGAPSSASQNTGSSPGAADNGSGGNPFSGSSFGQQSSSGQGGQGGQNGAGTFNGAGTAAAAGVLQPADAGAPQNFVNTLSGTPSTLPPGTTQFVALQIRHNAAAGTDTFTLQLEPAELGRLDIRLKFDKQGGVTAHLSADRPETLALLQKDAPELQRLLQQSGLSTNGNALSFDLRQQGQQQGSAGGGQAGQTGSGGAEAGDAPLTAQLSVVSPGFIGRSGVNIVV